MQRVRTPSTIEVMELRNSLSKVCSSRENECFLSDRVTFSAGDASVLSLNLSWGTKVLATTSILETQVRQDLSWMLKASPVSLPS